MVLKSVDNLSSTSLCDKSLEQRRFYIFNHVEPDHFSSFPKTMERLKDDVTVICSAKAIIVVSSTINNVIISELVPLLEELEGLRFKNKVGVTKRIADRLEKDNIKLVEKPLEVR